MSGWPPSKKSVQEMAAEVVSWPCNGTHAIVSANIRRHVSLYCWSWLRHIRPAILLLVALCFYLCLVGVGCLCYTISYSGILFVHKSFISFRLNAVDDTAHWNLLRLPLFRGERKLFALLCGVLNSRQWERKVTNLEHKCIHFFSDIFIRKYCTILRSLYQ